MFTATRIHLIYRDLSSSVFFSSVPLITDATNLSIHYSTTSFRSVQLDIFRILLKIIYKNHTSSLHSIPSYVVSYWSSLHLWSWPYPNSFNTALTSKYLPLYFTLHSTPRVELNSVRPFILLHSFNLPSYCRYFAFPASLT